MALRNLPARLSARLVDTACGSSALASFRAEACAGLRGTVLEIGFGGGRNLGFLPKGIDTLLALEPSEQMWARSSARRAEFSREVRRVTSDGSVIALASASVDAVLCTFTLCSVSDPDALLKEVHRVLRGDGELRLLEHGRSPRRRVRALQELVEPLQRRVAGGCRPTSDPMSLLERSPLEIAHAAQCEALRPRVLGYLTLATARRGAAS
jgi:ubiquinone/menaquinone biosynthesis C-methylase UbiE